MKTSESLNPTPEYPVGTEFNDGDRFDLHMTSEAVNSERSRALMDAAMHAESTKDFHDKQPGIASAQPERLLTKPQLIARNNLAVVAYRRDMLDAA